MTVGLTAACAVSIMPRLAACTADYQVAMRAYTAGEPVPSIILAGTMMITERIIATSPLIFVIRVENISMLQLLSVN
ncbi:hypothetical protein K439DRAFT_797954 [Ramaria rubella]|nr:hypothetical protein K439DRAFT_797954 [Ramaria rubella]